MLTFEEQDQWLRATWSGLVGNYEAMQGAKAYLDKVAPFPCACLLNDNQALRGPWFNSVEWLEHAWLPQAQHLGLRYIAHVVQANTGTDILTLTDSHYVEHLELQLFDDVEHAQEWLRSCQPSARTASRFTTLPNAAAWQPNGPGEAQAR